MEAIPDETLCAILQWLTDTIDIANGMIVCTRWNNSLCYLNDKYSREFVTRCIEIAPAMTIDAIICADFYPTKDMPCAAIAPYERALFGDHHHTLMECKRRVVKQIEVELRSIFGEMNIEADIGINRNDGLGAYIEIHYISEDIDACIHLTVDKYLIYMNEESRDYIYVDEFNINMPIMNLLAKKGLDKSIGLYLRRLRNFTNKWL